MTSILEICQDAASLTATQKPQGLFNSDSQQEAIFLSVAKSTLESLRRYGDWQELTKEGELRLYPNKQVYYIKDFCPDFFCLVNNTVFVKDGQEKVVGAVTPEQYMRERYFNVPEAGIKFKIQNGRFVFLQKPPANMKIVFNYRSANVCYDPTSVFCENPEKTMITKDMDVPLFDEYLVKLGIVWRWYKRNGMPYEEEFNEYEREVKKRFASGLATRDIDLTAGHAANRLRGVIINAAKSSQPG